MWNCQENKIFKEKAMTIKKKVLTASLIAVTLGTTACGNGTADVVRYTTPPSFVVWGHPSISSTNLKQAYETELKICEKEFVSVHNAVYDKVYTHYIYERCLRRKGWTPKKVSHELGKKLLMKYPK